MKVGKVKNVERSQENFIRKSIEKYGDEFRYTKVKYINSITKVELTCKIHGSFFVRPDAHLRKVGCAKCNGGGKFTQKEFLDKCKEIHGNKYDYSKVVYKNSSTKIEITCKKHGSFFMLPVSHSNSGQGCSKCTGNNKKTTEQFILEATKVHGLKRYSFEKVDYINNRIKVIVVCKKHGDFNVTPKDFLNRHGCSKCNYSSGEILISDLLDRMEIKYLTQHYFDQCLGISGYRRLPFDFYIPDFNMCIEYDGRQHFECVSAFGGQEEFDKLKLNDEIRNNFCLENDIELFRIKYNNVEKDMESLIHRLLIHSENQSRRLFEQ